MKRKTSIFVFLFLLSQSFQFLLNAQYFSSGNEPSNVKWRYIETDKLRVIYPTSIDSVASRFANIIDSSYFLLSKSMNAKSKKISVIFHNQNVLSNGFVTWAPKRMEIVTTPSRNYQAQDWMEGLALHEYRHVLQVDRLNTGLTRMLTFIAGQTAIGLPVSQVPLWFNEGDAVISETILGSGRGNLPTFEMPFKAYLLGSDRKFSYDKSYFGSLKDFVPDYYKLGYFLVGYSRLRFGDNTWDHIIHRVGKIPVIPYALNRSLKSQYSTSLNKIYNKTLDTLTTTWRSEYEKLKLTPYLAVNIPETRFYCSYRYPHLSNDGTIIMYKTSTDDIDKIIRLDINGKESVLNVTGNVVDGRLSCGSNLLVWDEIVSDLRWEQRNFSVIKTLNIATATSQTITKKSRYFSPCISFDDQRIAVVEIDLRNNSWLVILNAETGEIINRIASPERGLITFPYWVNSNEIIMIFTTVDKGKTIYKYSLNHKKWTRLILPTFKNISQLAVWKDYIIFSAGYSGIDNIYALDSDSNNIFQITSARYGAFDPNASGRDTLYYVEYTHNGYVPVKTKLNPQKWISLENIQNFSSNWSKDLIDKEDVTFRTPVFTDSIYVSKPYSRAKHLLNIHSWAPFYVDPQVNSLADVTIKPGLILLSQNRLSTAISSFGLSYENSSFIFRPTFTYTGFFPVIDFSARFGGPNNRHILPEGIIPRDTAYPNISFTLRSYVPFRIYRNKYFKLIVPEIDMEYQNTSYYSNELHTGIVQVSYKLLLFRYLILSQKDIYPKWGELINIAFTHTPFEKSQYGKLLSSTVKLYAPGITRHQSLGISGGFQYQNTKNRLYYYAFNRIGLPRGYSSVIDAFVSELFTKFTLDYNFPVLYPDFSLGSMMYIKRFRANIFTDYAFGYHAREYTENGSTIRTGSYYSYGTDIVSDLYLFRFYFPFSLGVRISYLPYYKTIHPELIFTVNTNVF